MSSAELFFALFMPTDDNCSYAESFVVPLYTLLSLLLHYSQYSLHKIPTTFLASSKRKNIFPVQSFLAFLLHRDLTWRWYDESPIHPDTAAYPWPKKIY